MKTSLRLSFRKGDIFAILLVIAMAACAALAFLPGDTANQNSTVQIYRDGRLVRELPLQQDAALQVTGRYANTLSIEDGRVAFVDSSCPGQDCIHSGWISGAGRSIVCLPNRVEIRITGASDVDFAVG